MGETRRPDRPAMECKPIPGRFDGGVKPEGRVTVDEGQQHRSRCRGERRRGHQPKAGGVYGPRAGHGLEQRAKARLSLRDGLDKAGVVEGAHERMVAMLGSRRALLPPWRRCSPVTPLDPLRVAQ